MSSIVLSMPTSVEITSEATRSLPTIARCTARDLDGGCRDSNRQLPIYRQRWRRTPENERQTSSFIALLSPLNSRNGKCTNNLSSKQSRDHESIRSWT